MEIIKSELSNIDSNIKIAIVVSRFNEKITQALLSGCSARLIELKIKKENIKIISVPGAIEIPLIIKKLAKSKNYQAIIALGAVIRGETSHYDYVCQQVSDGCRQLALDYELPIIFGVLTTDNIEQARDRIGGAHGHKGKDAAEAAVEMVGLMRKL